MEEALRSLIKEKTNIQLRPFKLIKLAGEASYREYYRIQFDDGTSLILMKMPAGYSSISEEVTKSEKEIKELPFVNVQKYLKELKLPVPEIFAYSPEKGFLLLQDLGDQPLEKIIDTHNNQKTIDAYKKAVDLLALIQKNSRNNPSEDCIAFYKKFDVDLLNWEFEHFLEYGIEDRLQLKMDDADKKAFREITRSISERITKMPQGFVLRDYQSRNIMVQNDSLWLIDFQDALLGSLAYDLVSLLRDSYIDLSPAQIKELQSFYVETVDQDHPYYRWADQLSLDFDLQTIQRKLKDAGRFQFIKTVKKDDGFLKNVPTSLKYVRQALERQSDTSELLTLLAKYLPEFQ